MPRPIDYGTDDGRPWRRMPWWAWAGVAVVGLLFVPWPEYATRQYLDLNSRDVRHETWVGPACPRRPVEPTAFSTAVRCYAGPRPAAVWSYQGERTGLLIHGYECAGFRPSARASDGRLLMQVLDDAHATDADRSVVVRRCAAFLAADQGEQIEAETNRMLDAARP